MQLVSSIKIVVLDSEMYIRTTDYLQVCIPVSKEATMMRVRNQNELPTIDPIIEWNVQQHSLCWQRSVNFV
jgi:hypothetical protein